MSREKLFSVLAVFGLTVMAVAIYGGSTLPNPLVSVNDSGTAATFSTVGGIDLSNPFFQNLGTNGRTCNSCHVASTAWTVSPPEIQARFRLTHGTDPIFRPVDGANCPSADVSTEQTRRQAYSMLLSKGLFRIAMAVPAGADFHITNIADPYNCPETTPALPALYRRPLPATNLPFLTGVMWDGRESPKGQSLSANLTQQAVDATMGHAQAASVPTAAQLQQIVAFETALFTAQDTDNGAGLLTARGASGGPVNLSQQEFYVGINDVLGEDPTHAAFDPVVFRLYEKWADSPAPEKASVARGEALFNSFPIIITGVAGLNDLPGLETVNGTCSSCHDTPNVGSHSLPLAINIGVTDYPAKPALDISGLPVYTILCNDGKTAQTTDLGRAMVTGKCSDIGKTKGPMLRGLAARAPYFHNGSAATLLDVLNFYEQRFNLSLTDQQKKDLVAFLSTL